MKLTVINIAHKVPAWVRDACAEYLTRINHGKYSCKLMEIKADKCLNKAVLATMAAEAKKISAQIPSDSLVVALDERGKSLNSLQFASFLEHNALNYREITFLIGGAAGLHPELRATAHFCLSLSTMVFPHALVRVIILEQIYRAISILENHPYHRE